MLVKDVAEALEKLAPVELAENWDNVGLLVGRYDREISNIMLSLDLTPKAVNRAKDTGANLIVTHHPPIFKPLKNLRTDLPSGMLWESLIKSDISVYTLHTNYDRAAEGLNEYLAKKLNLIKPQALEDAEDCLKLVVYLPKGYEDVIMEALTNAGAGWIGNYSHCTFQTGGVGTFFPREETTPFLGETGKLERVNETRLETILPARLQKKIIRALLAVHPYEEVAFDLYPLVRPGGKSGLGRVGNLPVETEWESFIQEIKKVFPASHIRVGGRSPGKVKRVAVIGGSGGKYIHRAKTMGADVLITSDLGYHEYMTAGEIGLTLVDPGHHVMEFVGLEHIKIFLEEELPGETGRKILIHKEEVEPYNLG